MNIFRSKKNVLILGAGQLGSELNEYLKPYCGMNINKVVWLDRSDLEISSTTTYETLVQSLSKIVNDNKINVIVNCIAYTDTCKAELKSEGYVDSYIVNAIFPKFLALYSKSKKIKLIHISTNYVSSEFGEEIPVNVYGSTKLLGEKNIQNVLKQKEYLIIRTSWLYSLKYTSNFVYKFIKRCVASYNLDNLFGTRELEVVDNEYGSPTHVNTLCREIYRGIINSNEYGLINCTDYANDPEGISRYTFASRILAICKYISCGTDNQKYFRNIDIIPIKTKPFKDLDGQMSYPEKAVLAKDMNNPNSEYIEWDKVLANDLSDNLENVVEDMKKFIFNLE